MQVRNVVVGFAMAVLAFPRTSVALPPVREERLVSLAVEVLAVSSDGTTRTDGSGRLELSPSVPALSDIDLGKGSSDEAMRLRLSATGRPGDGEAHFVSFEARLTLRDGRTLITNRDVRIRDGTTRLVEIYRDGPRRWILALEAEELRRPMIQADPGVGPPVRFRLDVNRLSGPDSVPLESNRMNTLVGEEVAYSFRRGAGDDLESVRLSLLPLRLVGDVVEVEIEVDGTLPGSPDRIVLSRRQRLLTTRGASSSVSVTAGDPPAGYRFVITPDF